MAEERSLKILFDSDSEEEFLRFTNEDMVELGREIIADSYSEAEVECPALLLIVYI